MWRKTVEKMDAVFAVFMLDLSGQQSSMMHAASLPTLKPRPCSTAFSWLWGSSLVKRELFAPARPIW